MKTSEYQKKRILEEKKRAVKLYRQGFSSRKVSEMLKAIGIKMSHVKVIQADRELSTE